MEVKCHQNQNYTTKDFDLWRAESRENGTFRFDGFDFLKFYFGWEIKQLKQTGNDIHRENMKTEDLVLRQKLTEVQHRHIQIVSELEREIFTHLRLEYQVKDIVIAEDQLLHTIYLPCTNKQLLQPQNFFFSHGFGGSSLMKFPVIGHLLKRGNLVLFQIRGMGLNQKKSKYQDYDLNSIQQYFQQGIECILDFYKPNNATFICHSFSSYLTLLFTIRNESMTKRHIKQLLMLSPIGLTPKQQDYKNSIRSCGDVIHTIIHKLGWTFNLTFKSPLRTICSCCKKKLVMNSLKQENLNEWQQELLYNIIEVLIMLPDGSQCLFYKYFEPRVLPKVPLEPLFVKQPQIPIVLVYGGENDWVDRIGAERVSKRFPNSVKLVQIPGITHNIAFHTVQCTQLFEQLFP